MFNASAGTSDIPREVIYAMVGYTERGFCGIFEARVSGREPKGRVRR